MKKFNIFDQNHGHLSTMALNSFFLVYLAKRKDQEFSNFWPKPLANPLTKMSIVQLS